MTTFLTLSVIAGAISVIDMIRHPKVAWEHADRDRFHWLMTGCLMTLFMVGALLALLYAVLVLPRFSAASITQNDFRKGGV